MKERTKRVYFNFLAFDYKAMEEYFEEMAEKGWMQLIENTFFH